MSVEVRGTYSEGQNDGLNQVTLVSEIKDFEGTILFLFFLNNFIINCNKHVNLVDLCFLVRGNEKWLQICCQL